MRKVDLPYIVYMHIAPNGKRYIGITSQSLYSRCRKGTGYNNNPHFVNAIQKYGWDNFEHIIVANNLTQKEACELEIKLIAEYKSDQQDFGYNLSPGGELGNYGRPCTDEIKHKISQKNKGRRMSEETKKKISETQKRKIHTPEHNKKVSEALKGKYVGELSSAYGLKRSDETKKKMSDSAKIGWEKRRQKYANNKWFSSSRRSYRNPD